MTKRPFLARTYNLVSLGSAVSRIALYQKDAREPAAQPADLRCAQNFSYQVFKARNELLDYFRSARASLAKNGLFVIDHYGGYDAVEERVEERVVDGSFTYVWDQQTYEPVTGHQKCAIHFRFDDRSELNEAFSYDWRYWSLPELRDLLFEAGFPRVDVYFEQFDEDGYGNGTFEKDAKGPIGASWIAYLVAVR